MILEEYYSSRFSKIVKLIILSTILDFILSIILLSLSIVNKYGLRYMDNKVYTITIDHSCSFLELCFNESMN